MITYPFRKTFRISKKVEFNEIFANKRKISGRFIYFYYKPNNENPKIAFIINKKKRNAVERNKLKRQLREIFRLNQYNLRNVSIIIGVKNGINEIKYSDLRKDFLETLRRAKCLKQ